MNDDFPHIDNLLALGRYPLAIEQTIAALRMTPDNPNLFRRLSVALTMNNDAIGGEEAAREAIRVDVDEAASHHALAMALMRQGRLDEADAVLDECHRLAPLHSHFFARHAALRYVQGRHREALAFARQSIALNPNEAWAHLLAARAAAALGQRELVDEHCRQSLRLEPMDAEVLLLHGKNLDQMERHGEAAAALLSAMKLNPHDESIHEALVDSLQSNTRSFRYLPIKRLLLGKLFDQEWILWLILSLLLVVPMAVGLIGSMMAEEHQGPLLVVMQLSMALGVMLILARLIARFLIVGLLQFDRAARPLLRMRDRFAGNGAFVLPVIIGVCWYMFAEHGVNAGFRAVITLPAFGVVLCLALAMRPGRSRRKVWAFTPVAAAALWWSTTVTIEFDRPDVTTVPLAVSLLTMLAALAMVKKEEWR